MQEWDKQDKESSKAFTAFSAYLELGPGRSLVKLEASMAEAQKKDPSKYSPKLAQLKAWSRSFGWVSRAGAWDSHTLSEALRVFEAKVLHRRVELQDKEWEAAEGLIARANEINNMPLTERIVTHEDKDAQGRVIRQFITLNPIKARAGDAARLLLASSKLARLSTGLETDRVKIDMEVQAQLEELFGELGTALTPDAFEQVQAYFSARTGERTEERDLN